MEIKINTESELYTALNRMYQFKKMVTHLKGKIVIGLMKGILCWLQIDKGIMYIVFSPAVYPSSNINLLKTHVTSISK